MPQHNGVRNILVVDDSRAQRHLVATSLRSSGFNVMQASSGAEALALCERDEIDIVLSDWMMPGMDGIELCRALRASDQERYTYFILLTSKSDKAAVAEGLEVGADDFLAKPVDSGELRARIIAGERVLAMERELRANNQLLTDTLIKLRQVYDSLDRDLIEARALQQSLLREREYAFDTGHISMLLRPSGHIGGDMVGCFAINTRQMGLYSFDVSGHGVASALMTARLAGLLSAASAEHNIAIRRGVTGMVGRPPAEMALAMNRLMLLEIQTERYVTLAYAELDLSTGSVRMVQAGHPHPVIQHHDGSISFLGNGGMPIGLIESADYEDFETRLLPGERLLLVSDGVTECPNPDGKELGEAGLERILRNLKDMRGNMLLETLMWELARWAGTEDFPDDVSCALFEFHGPPPD
ncbi:MAG: SpoIIE family protein phosphatase [Pararhodobacter sp.]|nr:SpoIIE family protein phosphatase [Pararhodobacter sp.]